MAPLGLMPGFKFHPTDEELVNYFLNRKVYGPHIEHDIIPEVDLYKFEPWELPEKALVPSNGDSEWYFFGPRHRKYPNGSRTNRATNAGYWKSTGRDRKVVMSQDKNKVVGMKKTLVFYKGRAPHGIRTDWVMHEYRLVDNKECEETSTGLQDAYALCRILKKNGGSSSSEMEEQLQEGQSDVSPQPQPDYSSIYQQQEEQEGVYRVPNNPSIAESPSPYVALMNEEANNRDKSWMQFVTDDDPWFSSTTSFFPGPPGCS